MERPAATRIPLLPLPRLLRPGGLLLLTIGNLTLMAAQMAGLNYRYLLPEFHISLLNSRLPEPALPADGLQPLLVRYAGAVPFNVIKSLPHFALKHLACLALRFSGVTRAPFMLGQLATQWREPRSAIGQSLHVFAQLGDSLAVWG